MKIIGIIPARYNSSRFPGKPLVDISGKTMIQRVFESSSKSKLINKLIVATDDKRIYDSVITFGGNVMMTSRKNKTGTDRICEVVSNLKLNKNDIIVNIQGDEPMISSKTIDDAIYPLIVDKNLNVSTVAIKLNEDYSNPNKVKVIIDRNGYAIYFSRLPIPFDFKNTGRVIYYKHFGIYVYRMKFLINFNNTKQTNTEKSESLEQLRILEMGEKIKVVISKLDTIAVDTIYDLKTIEKNKIFKT